MPITVEPEIYIPIRDMDVGDSFFIPSLNCTKDAELIMRKAASLKIYVQVIQCVYNDTQGVRVFCIKKG